MFKAIQKRAKERRHLERLSITAHTYGFIHHSWLHLMAFLRLRRDGRPEVYPYESEWKSFPLTTSEFAQLKEDEKKPLKAWTHPPWGYALNKERHDYDPRRQELVLRLHGFVHQKVLFEIKMRMNAETEALAQRLVKEHSEDEVAQYLEDIRGWQGIHSPYEVGDSDTKITAWRSPDLTFCHRLADVPPLLVVEVSYSVLK
ncbi:hypothetical protein CLAFUW4_10556 [Fulvia fulva]|nr:hypothetical protein CLAFUR4_10561 [Fulvia fulva]WPV18742.1 hypothetical protein CLAFUW4_10556 [Fulvia fulva]WPV34553.1 hypothetical protein CLAFUW7_10558 [Fulvia fulva]